MMLRTLAWSVVWVAIIVATMALLNNSATNNGLPLVKTAMPASTFPKNNMLFAPCPLTPRNVPLIEERSA